MAISPGGKDVIDHCNELEQLIDEQLSARDVGDSEIVTLPGAVPDAVLACLRDRYRMAGWTRFEVTKMFGSIAVILRR